MPRKLTIGNVIDFPVKGSLQDGARPLAFSFTLTGERLSTDAYQAELGPASDTTVADFLKRHISGWSGQRLVADDDGQPSSFDAESFNLLLSVVGMGGVILAAYLQALTISETSAGRAKN